MATLLSTALERDGQGKKNEGKENKPRKSKLISNSARAQTLDSKDGDDLTFIDPDAKRDGEDSVWRLLGPESDSGLSLQSDSPNGADRGQRGDTAPQQEDIPNLR